MYVFMSFESPDALSARNFGQVFFRGEGFG